MSELTFHDKLEANPVLAAREINAIKAAVNDLVTEASATAWEDVTFPLVAYRLESVAGTLQYNWDNASITMNASGDITESDDTLMFTCQIPHKTLLDSEARLHIHWEQPTDQEYTFDVAYRIQQNGAAKTTTWEDTVTVTMEDNSFTYVSGTLIQITKLLNIDLTDIGISDLIQVKLTRSDATAGDIEALAIDIHFEVDSMGSSQEYVK